MSDPGGGVLDTFRLSGNRGAEHSDTARVSKVLSSIRPDQV